MTYYLQLRDTSGATDYIGTEPLLDSSGNPVTVNGQTVVQLLYSDTAAEATLGTTADAAWTGTGPGSVVSLLKAIAVGSSGGGGAVSSVVGETGVVTAAQISSAIAGTGLMVSGGQLDVDFPAAQTLATYTKVANSTSMQSLAFSGTAGEIAVYDVTLAAATAFSVPTGAASTGLQQIILWIRQPASGMTYTPTFPSTAPPVEYPFINGTQTPPPVSTTAGSVTRILIETVDGGATILWGV